MRLLSDPISEALVKEALKRKSAPSHKRIEGELPEAPTEAADVPKWWSETATVLDRVRAETNVSLNTVESKVAETEVNLGAVDSKINASNIKKLYEENEEFLSNLDLLDRLERVYRLLNPDMKGCINGESGCPDHVLMNCSACSGDNNAKT